MPPPFEVMQQHTRGDKGGEEEVEALGELDVVGVRDVDEVRDRGAMEDGLGEDVGARRARHEAECAKGQQQHFGRVCVLLGE